MKRLCVALAAATACGGPPAASDDPSGAPEAYANPDRRSGVEATQAEPWPAPPAALMPTHRFSWPVANVHITSDFGWRIDPLGPAGTSGMRMHRGLDFRGEPGDLVLAIADGRVSHAGMDPALGNMVVVDHVEGWQSYYGHLSEILVAPGVRLERGAAVGLVGNTGRSAASHLHLTLKREGVAVDPLLLLGQPPTGAEALITLPGNNPVQSAPP